jgi:nucleoprotein TPR
MNRRPVETEHTLSQQLVRDGADRISKELIKKSEDLAQYRHEKRAALAQLESSHDALQEVHVSTEGSLKALRSAHNTQSQQLSQYLARVQDWSGRVAEQDTTYTIEVAGLRRVIEMAEAREAQSKVIVKNVEQEWRPALKSWSVYWKRPTMTNSLFLRLDLLYYRLLREVRRTS